MEGAQQLVIGKNLRRLRRELGYSQESFGEHIGWHRTFVGAVERGERNLTLRTVERLAQQLHVHPMLLLWDDDTMVMTRDDQGRVGFACRPPAPAADGVAPPSPSGR